jgi:hypothetical protein
MRATRFTGVDALAAWIEPQASSGISASKRRITIRPSHLQNVGIDAPTPCIVATRTRLSYLSLLTSKLMQRYEQT